MNALILGASGLVGGHCLDSILASPDYQNVIALTRRPLNRSSDKLIEQGFDGSDFSAFEPPVSIDHAFCAFGTTIKKAGSQQNMREIDVNIPFRLAQRLKALGVSHFSLVSSLGADYESNVFYNRIKGELEEAVKGDDVAAMEAKTKALTDASGNLAQKMYAEAQAAETAAGAGAAEEGGSAENSDAVDAEFEEVQEEEKE